MPTEKQWVAFGRLIHDTREAKGLTSPALAERLAMMVPDNPELKRAAPTIRHWENYATTKVKLKNPWIIRALERALELKRGTLFKELGMQPPETDLPPLRRPAPSVADIEWRQRVEGELSETRAMLIELLAAVERIDAQSKGGTRRRQGASTS